MQKEFMIRVVFFLWILVPFFCNANELRQRHAISYQGGHRFGDRMLVYAQARYLSYITSVPFLYNHFIYSDQVTIEEDARAFEEEQGHYQRRILINSPSTFFDLISSIDNPNALSTLFVLDYFPSDISEWESNPWMKLLLNIPWQEKGFHNYLQKTASPKIQIPNFRKEGVLNVADHVRTLSGADTADTSIAKLPLKHPNLTYHKNQIRRVYDLNQQKPMFVFIFSDTKNPQALIGDFRSSFENMNIEFGIQILNQADINYAVQDFYAMQKFDVLIATQSNFSMMASRIGSFDMILTPLSIRGSYPNAQIDRVQLVSQKSDWFPYDLNLVIRE